MYRFLPWKSSGLLEEWFESDEDIHFGPTLMPLGPITVRIVRPATEPLVSIDAHWREDAPRVDVAVPGFASMLDADCNSAIALRRDETTLQRRSYAWAPERPHTTRAGSGDCRTT